MLGIIVFVLVILIESKINIGNVLEGRLMLEFRQVTLYISTASLVDLL